MTRQAEQHQLEALLATDKSPDSHDEYFNLGSFYAAMGHHEKAVPQFRACLSRRELQASLLMRGVGELPIKLAFGSFALL